MPGNNKAVRHEKDMKKQTAKSTATSQDFDQLAREAEQKQKRKPGSQSNSSRQHNNGRGGGK